MHYGVPPFADQQTLCVEATLRYRQADQAVAEALLAAVPKDIDLNAIYGLTRVPQLPVVDMAAVTVDLPSRR